MLDFHSPGVCMRLLPSSKLNKYTKHRIRVVILLENVSCWILLVGKSIRQFYLNEIMLSI